MWKTLKIASAFIGVIVGAGFASGQEILKYFTSFGYLGMFGVFLSTALFVYLGMYLTTVGSRLKSTSHKKAIYILCVSLVCFIVDVIIIYILFVIIFYLYMHLTKKN